MKNKTNYTQNVGHKHERKHKMQVQTISRHATKMKNKENDKQS